MRVGEENLEQKKYRVCCRRQKTCVTSGCLTGGNTGSEVTAIWSNCTDFAGRRSSELGFMSRMEVERKMTKRL